MVVLVVMEVVEVVVVGFKERVCNANFFLLLVMPACLPACPCLNVASSLVLPDCIPAFAIHATQSILT